MDHLIDLVLIMMRFYFAFILWVIEFALRYWRTVMIATIVGGIFFAGVYFYNFYTLQVPNRNLIYALIAVWLVSVYLSYQAESRKDISATLNTFKKAVREFHQQVEKELTKHRSPNNGGKRVL